MLQMSSTITVHLLTELKDSRKRNSEGDSCTMCTGITADSKIVQIYFNKDCHLKNVSLGGDVVIRGGFTTFTGGNNITTVTVKKESKVCILARCSHYAYISDVCIKNVKTLMTMRPYP